MASATSRRFTLADAMFLVAAAALGTLLVRETNPGFGAVVSHVNHDPAPGMQALLAIEAILRAAAPFLAVWTPALLLLRLRQPRPRLNRLARQPGAAACAVATLAIVVVAVWTLTLWAARSRFMLVGDLQGVFLSCFSYVSFAVVGGWSVLALGGRWRSEASWIDRGGRATGVAWIVAALFHWAKYLLA